MDSQNLDLFPFCLELDFAVQEKFGKQNSKYIVSGKLHIYLSWLCRVKGSTLGIRLGHFRYGYSLLGAYERKYQTAQIQGK